MKLSIPRPVVHYKKTIIAYSSTERAKKITQQVCSSLGLQVTEEQHQLAINKYKLYLTYNSVLFLCIITISGDSTVKTEYLLRTIKKFLKISKYL